MLVNYIFKSIKPLSLRGQNICPCNQRTDVFLDWNWKEDLNEILSEHHIIQPDAWPMLPWVPEGFFS